MSWEVAGAIAFVLVLSLTSLGLLFYHRRRTRVRLPLVSIEALDLARAKEVAVLQAVELLASSAKKSRLAGDH